MSSCNFCCDDYIDENRHCCPSSCPPRPYPPRPYPPRPYPPRPYPPKPDCCCRGPRGASAFEIAQHNGFTGTEAAWLMSLRGATGAAGPRGATGPSGATGPWLSSYIEALADGQTIGRGASVAFDAGSMDSVGGAITLNQAGTVFTINRTGLYLVEWNVNLAAGSPQAVFGILENGAGASGATNSAAGNFSSGTLIYVDTVPFTISLHNYADPCTIDRHPQWENSAASIRIVRFADGPSI